MKPAARSSVIPLQLKLSVLLVLIVMVPLGVAAYFVGDISRHATSAATSEAAARVPVLQKSYAMYEVLINTTKQLHAEIAGRLAKRGDLLALDPELAGAQATEALGLDISQELSRVLARVLAEPQQSPLAAIAILRPDETVYAEASRPLAGPTWRRKIVDEPLGDNGAMLRLTFEVPSTVVDDLEKLREALTQTKIFMQMNEDDLPGGYNKAFIVIMFVAGFVAIGFGVLMSTLYTRRISMLVETARRVSQGRRDARVELHGNDEMGELAISFNTMLDDLDASRVQVEYLQRMGVWQDVARRLAHEIKNPLTPIQLAVQQCVSAYKGDDERYRKLLADTGEIVVEEIEALRRLVDTFRTLGALPKVEAAPLELVEVIEELKLDPIMATRLTLEPPESPVTVRADKLLLKRVLANLVENGIHAGQEAGTAGDVVIAWTASGATAQITIDDQGKGVAATERERIFEPYVTTKATGTGLGLAIARKIAIEHGGELSVAPDRAPTGGARFVVSLPLRGTDSSTP